MIQKKKGIRDGQFVDLAPDEIDYVLDDNSSLLGNNINLIPLQNAVASPRLFYGSRFFSQTDPLHDPDEPLVQNQAPDGRSFDAKMGRAAGAIDYDDDNSDAVVEEVTDDKISYRRLKDNSLVEKSLYRNYSLNRKNRFTQTALVKPGDKLSKGSILAKSNFTNDKGTLAVGRNARVGVVPYLGYSMDDATVISQSFADRLKSDHMLEFNAEKDLDAKRGKSHYISVFPDRYTKEQLAKLDDDGYAKPGSILEEGDPVYLETTPPTVRAEDRLKGSLGRYLRNRRKDNTQVWKISKPGEVVDAHKRKDGGVSLSVTTAKPAAVGDKIVMRSGAKFTVSRIIPDEDMPRTENGELLDVLANPLGIPSRVNNSFLYEVLLGKIAKKRGKPYVLNGFNNADERWNEIVRKELDKHGVQDTERVYDPSIDRYLENPITVGDAYFLKLQHQGESKLSGRGQGGYSNWEQPRKGGDDMAQAKRMSGLELAGLMSAGAYGYIKDGITVRGQKNEEYWRSIRNGEIPAKPGHPFAWDRVKAMMHGSGYMIRNGEAGTRRLGPLTDKDIDVWKAEELDNAEIVNLKNGKGVKGGLFDESRAHRNAWGKISLDYPLPNPAFEKPLLKLLNLKEADLHEVIRGKKELIEGDPTSTGPTGLFKHLKSMDKEDLRQKMKDIIKSGSVTKRPRALNVLATLEGLDRNDLKPHELMITQVPVIPARFRPFSLSGNTFLPGDVNELYQDVYRLRNQDRELRDMFGEDGVTGHKLDMYKGMKALYGFGPTQNRKLQEKEVKGFLKQVLGKSPKYSVFQRNLFAKPVDSSGRAVAGIDPTLGIDEVGLPEKLAWKMFAPYVQRRLVRQGMTPAQALKEVANQTARAKREMESEAETRPVVYARAPAWHKFNTLGATARIHDGNNIRVNPVINKGLNLDFDGDTLNMHLPSLPEAVKDVYEKLMPSKQIFSIRDNDQVVNIPEQDHILGLYRAATMKSKKTHTFLTRGDALRAIKQGKVSLSDEVHILEQDPESN